jgi:hypothetical protein
MSDGTIFITAKADLSQAEAQINNFSKRAQTTLTNLNLVVQDLPFGFIGIQNNLPNLIQSFGTLAKEEKGVTGALKAIGGALIGPVGLTFAVSAVVSGITFLIQKFGSLGKAFDAIFGKVSLATKSLNEYNKAFAESRGSTATESAEITILTRVLTDLSKPLKERQAAYVELKKISPEVVAGIKLENISTEKSIELINQNAVAIQKLIFLKAKEAALSTLINKNVSEQTLLEIERVKLIADLTKAENNYNKTKEQTSSLARTAEQGISAESITLNKAKAAYSENITKFNELVGVYKSFLSLLDPTVKGISEIDLKTKELNDTLKEQKVKKGRAGLFDFLVTEVDKGLIPISKLKGKLDKLLQPKLSPFRFDKPDPFLLLNKSLQAQVLEAQEIAKGYVIVKDLINNTFLQPLTNLFSEFLTTGKIGFKEFTKSILASITQMVAKLAATAIVTKLVSLFAIPTSLGGAFSPQGGLGGIGTLLSGLFRGGTGSANFGGVQGGGMGMSGQVNLVLRGTDLVGSINRTNSQISRVG